jgi:uncharacterized membrane protein YcaP (DUF421 family)
MHLERLTEDDVKEAAREQGIADLREVAVGILEADGQFSFIKATSEVDQQQVRTDQPEAT